MYSHDQHHREIPAHTKPTSCNPTNPYTKIRSLGFVVSVSPSPSSYSCRSRSLYGVHNVHIPSPDVKVFRDRQIVTFHGYSMHNERFELTCSTCDIVKSVPMVHVDTQTTELRYFFPLFLPRTSAC